VTVTTLLIPLIVELRFVILLVEREQANNTLLQISCERFACDTILFALPYCIVFYVL